jgi:hypothetical protein
LKPVNSPGDKAWDDHRQDIDRHRDATEKEKMVPA